MKNFQYLITVYTNKSNSGMFPISCFHIETINQNCLYKMAFSCLYDYYNSTLPSRLLCNMPVTPEGQSAISSSLEHFYRLRF